MEREEEDNEKNKYIQLSLRCAVQTEHLLTTFGTWFLLGFDPEGPKKHLPGSPVGESLICTVVFVAFINPLGTVKLPSLRNLHISKLKKYLLNPSDSEMT